eukprot:6477140-Amphidinium_carterae.1
MLRLGDGVPEIIDADVVDDVDVLECSAMLCDALAFEDELVDLDVVELDMLGDDVPELINADVVEVDVLKEVHGDVAAMELVVLGVKIKDNTLAFEDELVNVVVVKLDALDDDVPAFRDADVVEDVDVLVEVLGD